MSAYSSPDEILVYNKFENNYRCIVMGLFLHYFFLAQFTWILAQVWNNYRCIVMGLFLHCFFLSQFTWILAHVWNNYRCIVMRLFFHYFFLSQFTWIFAQVWNNHRCIVMGLFLHYFLLAQFTWILWAYITLYRTHRTLVLLFHDKLWPNLYIYCTVYISTFVRKKIGEQISFHTLERI